MAGTENQNQPVRYYGDQYLGLMPTVFAVNAAFQQALAPLQMLDGVAQNATMFKVKTNTQPVVIHDEYDTSVDGGSGATSRFGEATEIIYDSTEVPYDYTLSIHEMLDNFTVNEDMGTAITERLKLQLEAQVKRTNLRIGGFIADNVPADNKSALSALTSEGVEQALEQANVALAELEVDLSQVTAFVSPEVYNLIVKDPITTIEKQSSADIDGGTIVEYMGLTIQKTPAKYMGDGNLIEVVPNGTVMPFIGHEVTRTVQAENFDGIRLQSASKGGTFMLDDNKQALFLFTAPEAGDEAVDAAVETTSTTAKVTAKRASAKK